MALQQWVWENILLFHHGKDLCVVASVSWQLRAASETTVQRSLDNWIDWHPVPYEDKDSQWPRMCLVTPEQHQQSRALNLPTDALWHRYWIQAMEWYSHY
jgi:hypothetical protein